MATATEVAETEVKRKAAIAKAVEDELGLILDRAKAALKDKDKARFIRQIAQALQYGSDWHP